MKEHVETLRPKYFGFLEKLADESMQARHADPAFKRWVVRFLDSVGGAYCCWRSELSAAAAQGLPFNDAQIIAQASQSDDKRWISTLNKFGRVDDKRLLELIEPYVPRESDRRVFLEIVKQLWSEGQDLLANSG
jgi:hypothetical protein